MHNANFRFLRICIMKGEKIMNKSYGKRKRQRLCTIAFLLCVAMLSVILLNACNAYASEPAAENADNSNSSIVEVLRVTKPIKAGDKITSAKFETVKIDINETWIGAISDPSEVVGKYPLIDLAEGDFFISKYISSKKPTEPAKKAELEDNDMGFKDRGYIVITEYITANTGKDVAAEIQKIIDKPDNANQVIYFPDGEYIISKPICTASNGALSVSLKLSDNAVIKASDDWDKANGAMIRLGGQDQLNSINIPGSNYYIEGGIIDGNGKASGVAVDHGRETSVRDVTIVNTEVGLHVKYGANSGSSDADIENIRIVGNGERGSIGLHIAGWDNTYSNMRISNVQTGVKIDTAANLIRDIHVTFVHNKKLEMMYNTCVGFQDNGSRNWFDNCSATNFGIAFNIQSQTSFLMSCVARWTEDFAALPQVAMSSYRWGSVARSVSAFYTAPADQCKYLALSNVEGKGRVEDPIFDVNAVIANDTYKNFLIGKVQWFE